MTPQEARAAREAALSDQALLDFAAAELAAWAQAAESGRRDESVASAAGLYQALWESHLARWPGKSEAFHERIKARIPDFGPPLGLSREEIGGDQPSP